MKEPILVTAPIWIVTGWEIDPVRSLRQIGMAGVKGKQCFPEWKPLSGCWGRVKGIAHWAIGPICPSSLIRVCAKFRPDPSSQTPDYLATRNDTIMPSSCLPGHDNLYQYAPRKTLRSESSHVHFIHLLLTRVSIKWMKWTNG